jgi:hypothetical protein
LFPRIIRSLGSSVLRGKLPLGSHLSDIADFIELLKFWYSDFGMGFVTAVDAEDLFFGRDKRLVP